MAARVIAALGLALLGAFLFDRGLDARARAEPPGLVAGPGLLVGVEDAGDAEVRSLGLAQPAPDHRDVGRTQRSAGVAALAAALGLLAFRRARGDRKARRSAAVALRGLWAVPGVLGIAQLVTRAGASAPSAALARDEFVDGLTLVGLSMVLLAAWRA
ncbi:MAG: hypothetical protein AAF957_26540 [Planctomycetota bacterium]